jgi:signal transduction histidine kinase
VCHSCVLAILIMSELLQVGTVIDVTEVILLQHHVLRQEEELRNVRLQKALDDERRHRAEMHTLLRTLSHEIRNPLQGILSNTQTLLSLTNDEDKSCTVNLATDDGLALLRDNLKGMLSYVVVLHRLASCASSYDALAVSADILECALHQLMVIDDFLDLEMARSPDKSIKTERCNIDNVAASVVRMFKTPARNKVRNYHPHVLFASQLVSS